MPVHAGFAYAIQVRKKVLNDSLLLAYHAGKIRRLTTALISGPPTVGVNFHLELPQVTFDPAHPDAFVLTLSGAGSLTVQFDAQIPETREVRFQMVALIEPRFAVAPGELTFSPQTEDISLSTFTFSVIQGAPFSSAAATYLASPVFRERMEANVALGLSLGVLEMPPIKIGQLGSLLDLSNTTTKARVLDESILIGLSLESPALDLIGEIQELVSFAGSHDIALVLNPAVLPVVLGGLLAPVEQSVRDAGATLDSLSVTAGTGKLLVAGAAHNDFGSVSFSLNATLALFASRPGKYFQYLHRHVAVNHRTWPAITFHAENIQVSVKPATWVRIVQVASVALTGAVVPLYIESLISGATHQITFAAKQGFAPPSIARVQRLEPQRPGDPHIKLRINDFSIAPAAIFAGLSVTPQLPRPMLMGLTKIPSNYLSRQIRYRMILPIGVLGDDPYLRIRWQVQNLSTGQVVLNEDGPALGRLEKDLRFSTFGGPNAALGISAEVYRRVGTQTTPVFNDGIQLVVSEPLLPGMLQRWRYGVKNPQVRYSEADGAWSYQGEATILRWSALHRLDKPCKHATKRSRYVHADEVLDDLPYALTEIADRREHLCTYCFFGGPGEKRPFL